MKTEVEGNFTSFVVCIGSGIKLKQADAVDAETEIEVY